MRGSRRNPGGRNDQDWGSAASRYEVLERVGEGTLFVVYRVRDRNDNRVFALKALKGAFSRHPKFAPALAQAAHRAVQLAHPNLGRLLEMGEEEGTLFLVSEWLPGASLETRLRRAPFTRAEIVADVQQIAEALSYLHQNGALHGDLRPRQVLAAADGTLKLTDANLADAFTMAGVALSDVEHDATYYLAPERFDGAPPTAASDLYALGVILYRMLTGRVPFDGPSPLSIAMRHRNDAPLHPSQFNRECPPDLEAITLRLLEKNPQMRYPSAAQLLNDLAGGVGPTINTAPPSAAAVAPSPQSNGLASPPPLASDAANADSPGSSAFVPSPVPPGVPSVVPTVVPPIVPVGVADAPTANGDPYAATAVNRMGSATSSVAAAQGLGPAPATISDTDLVANGATLPAASAVRPVPPAPVAAVAAPVTTAPDDVGIWEEEEAAVTAKRTVGQHRRRERNGALLAVFWTLVAAGLLAGIIYGGYYFWVKDIPHDVIVPTYVGLPQYEAERRLAAHGLKLHIASEKYDTRHPSGTVLSGDRDAGTRVKIGHDIGVTVSRGEERIAMYDFSEITLERARQIIVQHGMRLGQVAEQYHDRIPQGYICGQYPEPGQPFSRSEPINLVVSKGQQPSEVPQDPALLPPPPAPPSITDDNASGQAAIGSEAPSSVPMVSRAVRVRVAIPADGPKQEVRVVVRDADGEHILYRRTHAPGDLVDQLIHVPRPQGTTATVRVYVGGALQREEQV
ncbi:MAG: protein kinase [Abitibacteriaceae bacterium]|nr:protein kinase [Abditibacteriaceae bacterium]